MFQTNVVTIFQAKVFKAKVYVCLAQVCLLTCLSTQALAEPDILDEPIGADILDEPIGADILDEPIGPELLKEPATSPKDNQDKKSDAPKNDDQTIKSQVHTSSQAKADTQDTEQAKQAKKPVKPKRKKKYVTLKKVSIIGNAERISRVSGSAHQVKEEELEEQNYDDVHRVLKQVPGVYVRDEDGQGLRPNIGLRGANSDRSAKVTLMEDGVLMAPAPYSAPAAYYFPMTTRLTAVEVFKGPASIQYGPQTIGGALNMGTRQTPRQGLIASIDGAYGQYQSRKVHSYLGWGNERYGLLLEGVNWGSDGFKELDGGGSTGFDKSELMFKARINSDPNAEIFHSLELKLGWAIESSNETYLGLSESDFELTPYRRYSASSLAQMTWDRLQGQVDYQLAVGDNFDLRLTAYRHQFARAWEKMNGFNNNSVSFEEVLRNPSTARNSTYYSLLNGTGSSTDMNEWLRLGMNDREYLSQGVQLTGQFRQSGKLWKNQVQLGLRVHQDWIIRDHSERLVSVNNTQLNIESNSETIVNNRGETLALSAFIFDELRLGKNLRLTPGLRLEQYTTTLTDLSDQSAVEGDDWVLLPGIGLWYTLSDHWGVLAGMHKGFSPLSLSQTGQAQPEESINYEAGTRWQYPELSGELILFLNDYKNLVGTCTQSAGCQVEQLDQQFNAGSALIYGAEFSLEHAWRSKTLGQVRAQLSYTYTHGRFQESFRSGFAQWGEVSAGDALPYVPEHQASLKLNWSDLSNTYGFGLSDTLVSPMLDQAGTYSDSDIANIPTQHVIDAHAFYWFTERLQAYSTVDNILNTAYMTSLRPFGARPGKPLLVQVGARYSF